MHVTLLVFQIHEAIGHFEMNFMRVAIATDYMLLKIAEFKSRTLENIYNPISASESLKIQDC